MIHITFMMKLLLLLTSPATKVITAAVNKVCVHLGMLDKDLCYVGRAPIPAWSGWGTLNREGTNLQCPLLNE
jgi:hypothetical protein